jgi:hypothetical protein
MPEFTARLTSIRRGTILDGQRGDFTDLMGRACPVVSDRRWNYLSRDRARD